MLRCILEFFFLKTVFSPRGFDASYFPHSLPPFLTHSYPPSLPLFLLTSENSYKDIQGKFEKWNQKHSYSYDMTLFFWFEYCIIFKDLFWFAYIIYNYIIVVKVNNFIQCYFMQLMTTYYFIKQMSIIYAVFSSLLNF